MRASGAPSFAPGIGSSIATGATVAVLSAWLAQPAPGAGDQAELAAVAWSWGVAHPTGYPLWTLLAHGWVVVCHGEDPARSVAWLSALFAGVAAALTAEVGAAFGSRVAGIGAALAFAFSPIAWQQATQVEVYPLFWVFQALEVMALRRALAAPDDRRARGALFAAAGVGGLGTTHHLLIGLLLPAALLVLWQRRSALRPRDLVFFGCLAGLPLLLYGLIPWRASLLPVVSWNRVTSFEQLVAHATGQQYHGIVGDGGDLQLRPLLVAAGGGITLGILACFTLFALARLVPRGSAAILLAYLVAGLAFAARYPVVDQEVFYLPAIWTLCLSAALGIEILSGRFPIARLFLVGLPLAELTNVWRLEPALDAHDHDLAVLQAAPPGAIAYVGGKSGFTLIYPLLVRGLRPDMALVDHGLHLRPRYPDYVDRLGGEPLPEGLTAGEWIIRTLLDTGLPIVADPDDPIGDLEGAHAVRLQAGVLDLISRDGPPPAGRAVTCGQATFEGAVLGTPCDPIGPVSPLSVVYAPLTWTSPYPEDVQLVLVEAADERPLAGGSASPVLIAPLGMGRRVALLPDAVAWTDPVWVAVPRWSPPGRRGLWLALRRGGGWVPVQDASAQQGPFVRVLSYTVSGEPPRALWTFPG